MSNPEQESQTASGASPQSGADAPVAAVYPNEWSIWTKRIVAIALVIAGIWALNLLGPIIYILILSLLLAFLLFIPSVSLSRRTRLSYGACVGIVFVVYLFILFFLLLNFLPQAINQVNQISSNTQQAITEITEFLVDYEPDMGVFPINDQEIDLNFVLEPLSDSVKSLVDFSELDEDQTGSLAGILFDGIQVTLRVVGDIIGSFGSLLSNLAIVHLIALLFLVELPQSYAMLYRFESDTLRREYLIVLQRIYRIWIQFFEVQVITGIVIGLLTWLQFIVMGIPGAVFIGIFTGLTSLIPNIGGFLALVPMALIPLFEGSTVMAGIDNFSLALLVIGINFVMQMVFWNVIVPVMTSDALELSVSVIILGVFVGAAIGGVLGAFLVVPIMGSVKVILTYVIRKLSGGDPYPGEEEPKLWSRELLGSLSRTPETSVQKAA